MKTRNFVSVAVVVVLLGMLPITHGQRQFLSDFNDGAPDWDDAPSIGSAIESGGQLIIRATLPASMGGIGRSLTGVSWDTGLAAPTTGDGQTLEYRVDLVRTSRDDVLAGIEHAPAAAGTEGLYGFLKDGKQLFLLKVNLLSPPASMLFYEQTTIKHQNVVLSLAFTGLADSVRITARVLDKDADEAVLFEKTIVDTLISDESVAPLPHHPNLQPDPGPPYLNGRWATLYLAQYTDGNQPEVEAVYDNFTYEYRSADPFTKISAGQLVTDEGLFFTGAWGDFDDDGLIDLFVSNEETGQGNFIYRNLGGGTFSRLPRSSFPQTVDVISGTGAWGDVDNDGDLDLFLPNGFGRPLQDFFYRNNGDGTFMQITEGSFVNDTVPGNWASWIDYDGDGFLDLFVANGRNNPNFLYRNEGDGTFSKLSNALTADAHHSHGSSWADYDNDGDSDLFVPNLNANNYLFENLGNGTFSKITQGPIPTSPGQSEEGAWGDYDNDGDLDLFVVNFAPGVNQLFRNEGGGSFQQITSGPLVSLNGYGASWADYDNDGHLDLLLFGYSENDLLYRNEGDGTFSELTFGTLFTKPVDAQGGSAAWGDYNNDGFLDLFVTVYTGATRTNQLYSNKGNPNSWLKVKLVGTASNRSAIGAKVRVQATISGKSFWQMREISSGGGFGQHDFRANFGLGDTALAETVRIEWPSGTVQELHDVPANQILTITEPPKLLAEGYSGATGFRYHLLGAAGMSYHIEYSSDLLEWTPAENFVAIERLTPLEWLGSSFGRNIRFFRAVQAEP